MKKVSIVALLSFVAGAWFIYLLGHRTSRPESLGAITEDAQDRVAYHEAGHAVVGAILRPLYPVTDIIVYAEVQEGTAYGMTHHESVNRLETVEDIMADAVEDLAGREAERVLLGQATNAGSSDLRAANMLFVTMCGANGLCGSLIVEDELSPETVAKIDRCLNLAQARARIIVEANADTIRKLGELVLAQPVRSKKRTLTADQLRSFLKERTLITEAAIGQTPAATCP